MLGTERLRRKTCASAAPALTASPKAAWPVASSPRGLAQPAGVSAARAAAVSPAGTAAPVSCAVASVWPHRDLGLLPWLWSQGLFNFLSPPFPHSPAFPERLMPLWISVSAVKERGSASASAASSSPSSPARGAPPEPAWSRAALPSAGPAPQRPPARLSAAPPRHGQRAQRSSESGAIGAAFPGRNHLLATGTF